MGAFLIGLAAAAVLALVSALGLNAVAQYTAEAFYTGNTVPGSHHAPTDGTLDQHEGAKISEGDQAR